MKGNWLLIEPMTINSNEECDSALIGIELICCWARRDARAIGIIDTKPDKSISSVMTLFMLIATFFCSLETAQNLSPHFLSRTNCYEWAEQFATIKMWEEVWMNWVEDGVNWEHQTWSCLRVPCGMIKQTRGEKHSRQNDNLFFNHNSQGKIYEWVKQIALGASKTSCKVA